VVLPPLRHGNRPGVYYYHTTTALSETGPKLVRNAKREINKNTIPWKERKAWGPDLVHSTTTLGPLAQLFDRFSLVTRLIVLREDYVGSLSSSRVELSFTR
jgi:hypothetical protein